MTAAKAITAFFTSALSLLAMFMHWGPDVVATWTGIFAAFITAMAPLLVYLIPNSPSA